MGSSLSFAKGDSGTLMPIEAQGGDHFIIEADEAGASDGASQLNSGVSSGQLTEGREVMEDEAP